MRRLYLALVLVCLALGVAGCDDAAPTAPDTSTAPLEAAPGTTEAASDGVLADPAGSACCKQGDAECSDDCACKQKAPGAGESAPTAKAACLCAQGKAGTPVWCDACDKGFVKGKEVCCKSCVKDAQKTAKADSGQ